MGERRQAKAVHFVSLPWRLGSGVWIGGGAAVAVCAAAERETKSEALLSELHEELREKVQVVQLLLHVPWWNRKKCVCCLLSKDIFVSAEKGLLCIHLVPRLLLLVVVVVFLLLLLRQQRRRRRRRR